MILGIIFMGLNAMAVDCTQIQIDSSGKAFKINSVLFQRGEEKKFCLRLPKVDMPPEGIKPSPFIEWVTVNKGNASCGVLKMRILRPNKADVLGNDSDRTCNSKGPQPGCALTYTQGQWIATYTLQEVCRPGLDRWDLEGTWSLKP